MSRVSNQKSPKQKEKMTIILCKMEEKRHDAVIRTVDPTERPQSPRSPSLALLVDALAIATGPMMPFYTLRTSEIAELSCWDRLLPERSKSTGQRQLVKRIKQTTNRAITVLTKQSA